MTAAQPDQAPARLFSPKVVLAMLLVGVFSFSAFLALSAYAPDLRSGEDGRGHALSRSAIGFAGLVQLLRDQGRRVLVSRGAVPWPSPRLLILTPEPQSPPKASSPSLKTGGWMLVVLPKWAVAPKPLQQGWVDKAGLLDDGVIAAPLKSFVKGVSIEHRRGVASPVLRATASTPFDPRAVVQLGRIDSLQTVSGPGLTPVLVDEQGKAVVARYGQTNVVLLADPDVFNTQGLAQLANARAANDVIGMFGSGPIVFDVTMNGFERGRSLLRLMFEPPLLGVVICLLAAAALMGLHAAGRFGPPQRSVRSLALGKQALADNSAGLIRMARREPRMAEGYAALARETVARAVGVPRDLSAGELDGMLDRLGGARGISTPFSALDAEAKAVKTNGDLMRLARRLYDWRLEMTRDRR